MLALTVGLLYCVNAKADLYNFCRPQVSMERNDVVAYVKKRLLREHYVMSDTGIGLSHSDRLSISKYKVNNQTGGKGGIIDNGLLSYFYFKSPDEEVKRLLKDDVCFGSPPNEEE
jgi:hypothetical protein